MSRIRINENDLKKIINESIQEVINEGEFDEGIGHKLGSAFQNIRNKWRNFTNDFKAGQNDAREKNKDYNAYAIFGDREDAVRSMGNGEYSNYRYNLEKKRNQEARGKTVTPNPDLETQNTLPKQNEKMNAIRAKKEKEERARLYRAGLVHQGSYDNPTGWRRKDDQELDASQQNLINNWKKYKLQENKKKK